MTLPTHHPHFGCAITLTRAMSTQERPGATPHTKGHPWSEDDAEASREILRRRLAKKQDRLEERTETVSAQRLRIQELEEHLREAYRLVDTYSADMTEEAFRDLEQHFISALDRAEGSTNE